MKKSDRGQEIQKVHKYSPNVGEDFLKRKQGRRKPKTQVVSLKTGFLLGKSFGGLRGHAPKPSGCIGKRPARKEYSRTLTEGGEEQRMTVDRRGESRFGGNHVTLEYFRKSKIQRL